MGKLRKDAAATKSDVSALKSDVQVLLKRLDKKIDLSVDRLDKKIDSSVERLDKKIDGVVVELIKTQGDVREIKETMATKADTNRILGAIDAFAKQAESYDRKSWSHGDQLSGHETRLRDHERRTGSLEEGREDVDEMNCSKPRSLIARRTASA